MVIITCFKQTGPETSGFIKQTYRERISYFTKKYLFFIERLVAMILELLLLAIEVNLTINKPMA